MSYDALKNKQNELIRKALDGSVFLADVAADAISDLTVYNATATSAVLTAPTDAVDIVTGGDLVLAVDGANVTTALLAADTPAGAATKIDTALGAVGNAAIVGGKLEVTATSTGTASTISVVSGTGTVLANLGLTVGLSATGAPAGIDLAPLPNLWDDLGFLTNDGAQFARDVSQSEVTSWGSVTPTRTDVITDTSTLTVAAQETKLLTIGLATGADLSGIVPTLNTGEVSIAKPSRPKSRHYRALSLAVDEGDGGEIYVARFLPRAKVSSYAEQSFGGGDDPVIWGVTFTGETDSDLGYSERWIFGGAGWLALLDDMGFPEPA